MLVPRELVPVVHDVLPVHDVERLAPVLPAVSCGNYIARVRVIDHGVEPVGRMTCAVLQELHAYVVPVPGDTASSRMVHSLYVVSAPAGAALTNPATTTAPASAAPNIPDLDTLSSCSLHARPGRHATRNSRSEMTVLS